MKRKERNWLIHLRKQAGLSQQELADSVGISRSYISEIENGVKSPSGNAAMRIARRLKFDMALFFEDQRHDSRLYDEQAATSA